MNPKIIQVPGRKGLVEVITGVHRFTDSPTKTMDSTLAFYVNQLDNLDRRLYMPLYSVTWGRDINLRTGLTFGHESSSFVQSNLGAIGTQGATGKPWISPETTTIPGVSVNGERIVTPMRLLGREISYTSVELDRSQQLGQPIDAQKMDAFNTLYQMDTDAMVYVGDDDVGAEGLCNSSLVTTGNTGSGDFTGLTPDAILVIINEMLTAAWTATGYAVCPREVRLDPVNFGHIATAKVSDAGNISVLEYVRQNSVCMAQNGVPLNIQSLKHLTGAGVGGANRMMAYTNEEQFVRFPMVPVRRETSYYKGISFIAPYIWMYGEVEFVKPETVIYRDHQA